MMPARLSMTLLVGGLVWSAAPVHALEGPKAPEARRINLDLKSTPLRQALGQVFVPGRLRVKLEANVPALPLTLALKEVDEDTAFRLLMRQAKKQEKDLQYEATDDGYRIYLGAPAQEAPDNPYPLTPQPKLPKPLAPPTPDFPVVQNREVEPFIGALLQRVQNGEPLLPAPAGSLEAGELPGEPAAGPDVTVTFGTGAVVDSTSNNTAGGGYGLGYSPLGSSGYGAFGSGGSGFGSGGYGLGSYGLGGSGFGNYGGFGLGMPRMGSVDPYSSPLAGGLAVSDQISQRLYEKKKPPKPYFYNHTPQWILEHRTKYWGNGGRPPRGGRGPSPSNGNDGSIGGGYLPR